MTDPRVEKKVRPVGVDVRAPRLSWVVDSAERDVRLEAFRVRVAAGPAALSEGDLVWDSGVRSEKRTWVDYDGAALASDTEYHWQVDVVTSSGGASVSSHWRTGLFELEDWSASSWIGNGRERPGVRPAPLLRTEFTAEELPVVATMFVAAAGYARVSLNGHEVNDHVVSPGPTDFDHTVQYVASDVTALLQRGANAIGVELGRGFYGLTGGNVWGWERAPWHDEPTVRAVLRLHYATGVVEVGTDGTWSRTDGPTRFDDVYAGEIFDTSHAFPGYDTAGFDASDWARARVVAGPRGNLVAQRDQPIRAVDRLRPAEILERGQGVFVVGFPRVLAGWVRLRVRAEGKTRITARYAERLTRDGWVDQSNNGEFKAGFQTDVLYVDGVSIDVEWEPRFSYKGFQYVEIRGWPGCLAVDDVTAVVVHSDAPETGGFSSSDPMLNRVHRAVVDTITNNLHGIPTDTPMFEKNGWTGDATVGAEMMLLNLDVHELLAKWMADVHDARDAQGAPKVIAPGPGDWGQWGVATPWHAAYIFIPWWLHVFCDDDRTLRSLYEGMASYVQMEFDRSAEGIVVAPRLGDWMSPDADPDAGNPPEDLRVASTAYLAEMLRVMRDAADHLGRSEDALRFDGLARTVARSFQSEFFDPAGGICRGVGDEGFRQTHNVLALAFGLIGGAEDIRRVLEALVDDIRTRGNRLNTGVLGTKYLLRVLTDYGHADLAAAVARQPGYPGWAYLIAEGATTMWEHWSKAARSRGHYFLGTIDDWLFRDVAGLAVCRERGGVVLDVAPRVTRVLESASAHTVTPLGLAQVGWHRDADVLRLDIRVPVGASARVRIPATDLRQVTEGGVPVSLADGCVGFHVDRGEVIGFVASGRYHFCVGIPGAS
nr:alpha-L-rhamnosidase [Microbacterium immunditiarum]